MKIQLNRETIELIENLLNKNKQLEIKREKDNIVIIEIKRQVKIKSPIIGQVSTVNKG